MTNQTQPTPKPSRLLVFVLVFGIVLGTSFITYLEVSYWWELLGFFIMAVFSNAMADLIVREAVNRR